MSNIDTIKAELSKKMVTKSIFEKEDMLSTGITLLNLALTGTPYGGLVKGMYYFLVGDSSSGKSFLSRMILAEATLNKHFDDYKLVYDDVERGVLMDTAKYFGQKLADRIEPPAFDEDGDPIYSDTVEDFYFNAHDRLISNDPCIWIEDSMDGLSSDYEGKKFDEKKTANRKGTQAKGDYGDGKAKINSSGMRQVVSLLRDTGSIMVVVNQTRDNINAGLFESKKTRSGGKALTFYAMSEMWMSVGNKIDRTVRGTKRKIGTEVLIRIKKNRGTGRDRLVRVPIYYSVGFDDVEANVNFLLEEGYWKPGAQINAKDFDFKGRKEQLVQHINSNDLEPDLVQLVTDVWKEIEEKCEVVRKPKYS